MIRSVAVCAIALAALAVSAGKPEAQGMDLSKPEGAVRVATFNASLYRPGAGVLAKDITERDDDVLAVAETILRVRPDIILINEFDHDAEGQALGLFLALLQEGVGGLEGIAYTASYAGPVNTGEPSSLDLDGDGSTAGPNDAWGFGRFPGQYGMVVLSRFPVTGEVRSFQTLLWSAMPGALRPMNPDGTPYHPDEIWAVLRLSSKSHWDVPVALPDGRVLHILASHPTPPVFDGPEDRNGTRNHDEIRFWSDYIAGADWPIDDAGLAGGLAEGADFVILGDLNADPADGDGRTEAIRNLLADPLTQDPGPASPGGLAAAGEGVNPDHKGDPALDTADWRDDRTGNLRVDFVIPSATLKIAGSGVFWPIADDPLAKLLKASDHRLVWIDIAPQR